ncbi:hypothetical protein B5M09_006049 [Aphanomyces astaci]|uniref:Uncharacterized protein n=1 Tax=Aphanomyces astaci TaxID=112090 RepID=A0A3R7YN48_APHAT|nr:hypothetical protein B5M09_006049 [Aphanomyces astaci]
MKQAIASLVATALLVQAGTGPQWEEQDFRALLASQGQTVAINQCPAWATPIKDFHISAATGVCLNPANNVFNFASGVGLNAVPFPYSSYPYSLDHPLFTYANGAGVAASTVSTLPRITVQVLKNADPTVNVLTPDTETAFHWQDFDENRNARVWSRVGPLVGNPGVYKVDLNAHDYYVDSGVCELCFTVTDHYRPKSSSLCPAAPAGGLVRSGWTAANVAALDAYLDGAGAFSTSRGNNGDCNTAIPVGAPACADTTVKTPSDWFNCALDTTLPSFITSDFATTPPGVGTLGCVRNILATNPFATDSTLQSPGGDLNTGKCTRTVTFDYHWYEYWTQFSCTAAPAGQCTSGTDASYGGDESGVTSASAYQCANTVTLSATANNLVTTASLTSNAAALQSNSQFISDPRGVFFEDSYTKLSDGSNNQVHFWSPLVAGQDADLDVRNPVTVPIQSVFSTSATGSALPGLTLPAVSSRVFWRWTTNNPVTASGWNDYSANGNLVLTDLLTTVTFESWTYCGQKGSSISWNVYNHRHQSIQNVDEWFQPQWSYVSKPRCNVPHSDFGVVQFAFDLDDLNARIVDLGPNGEGDNPNGVHGAPLDDDVLLEDTTHVDWRFSGATCAWKYGNPSSLTDFTVSDYAWAIDASDFVSAGNPPNFVPQTFQFAPKLINAGVTTVTVYCDFAFTDTLNSDVVTVYQGAFGTPLALLSKTYPVGSYNLPNWLRGPILGVSSLRIENGYSVTLFKEFNNQGASITYTTDVPYARIISDNWNNEAKSLRIDALPGTVGYTVPNTVHISTDKTFVFENCDVPTILDPSYPVDNTCVAGCSAASWNVAAAQRLAAPFQASGGNLIFPAGQWDDVTAVATVFQTDTSFGCCTSCNGPAGFGAGITAVSAPWTAGSPISRCQPSNYAVPNPAPTQVDPTVVADPDAVPTVVMMFAESMGGALTSTSALGVLAVFAVVAVVAGLAFQQSKLRQFVVMDDAYTSLTDASL